MVRLVQRGDGEVRFVRPSGMPEPLFRLLCARGIESEEEAAAFLSPSLDQLHDPMLLSAMNEAIALIERARNEGSTVCVYGDYDVDGVCATAVLGIVLGKLGIKVKSYIPKRHDEGYGLNESAIREIANWAGLLITVDCGVTAVEQVDLCNELGLPVIITDHHQPSELLPACPVVNPLLDGYPFPSLCGAGVAFKLAMALDREQAMKVLDLACLATVADVVPLQGENRAIVACGLVQIQKYPRPGIAALASVAGIKLSALRASGIAFVLGPRLNAGGRLGDADRALQLLIAKSAQEADPLAQELEAENQMRRDVEAKILTEANLQMAGFDFASRRVIVLHGADWNVGVIGLAASRLVEKYHMPTVLLSGDGGELTGSCRSIPGVDIHWALGACSALLTRFGGHKQAAGLSIPRANVGAFTEALDAFLHRNADPAVYVPREEYDLEMGITDLTEPLVGALSKLEPFGFGNPAPVMLSEAKVESARAVGADGAHLSMKLTEGGATVSAIGFRMGAKTPNMEGWLRLLYQPKINEFNGWSSVQMELKAVLPPRPLAALTESASKWDAMERMFLTEKVYNWAHTQVQGQGEPQQPCAHCPPQTGASEAKVYADVSDAVRWLAASAYGTLIVATDRNALLELLEACEEAGVGDRFDLLFGRWPDAGLPISAVCVLPLGEAPLGYSRVIMLDAPGALLSLSDAWEPMTARAAWMDEIPDVDALRMLYVCVRDLLRRPMAMKGADAVLSSLAQDGRVTGAGAALGLAVLSDMELIRLGLDPFMVAMADPKKADPSENRTFQWLQDLRGWGR